jgi:hypothetical protein
VRLSLDAVAPTARAARLPVVGLGLVAAAVVVAVMSLHDDATAPIALMVAGITGAAGFGAVLDDPASDVLAPSPTTFAGRRLRRIGLGAAVLAVGWLGVLSVVESTLTPPSIPAGAASLEVAALASVVLALSAAATRITGTPGGTAAALGLVPVTGFVAILGHVGPSWPLPSLVPGDDAARWWCVLVVSLAIVAWLSRDPGAPKLLVHNNYPPESTARPSDACSAHAVASRECWSWTRRFGSRTGSHRWASVENLMAFGHEHSRRATSHRSVVG